MINKKFKNSFHVFYFFIFIILLLNTSITSFSQVKTIATLNLEEDEKVYNVYTDASQTKYAVVIIKTTEGLVSTLTEYYVILSDSKIGPFEKVVDIVFFDNGKQFLISVKKDGLYYIYKNNDISGPYENISRFSAIFSSNFYAYWVKESGNLYVINPDKKLGPYAEVSAFTADQNTKRIVWTVKSDKSELFINGISTTKADKIVIFGFYTDKSILCYATGQSGAYSLTVGSTIYGPYQNIGLDLAVKDEKLVSFFAKINDYWYLIAGKEKAGPFDSTGHVAISPDGKKIAYAGYTSSNGWAIYLGAKLLKNIDKPYFAFLDFIKVGESNYDLIYLAGEDTDGGYYWGIYIGENEEPFFDYILDSSYPYVGSLNINYYGVDFMIDNNGTIAFLAYNIEGTYKIGIISMKDADFGLFGPGDDYDTTFILDVANNVVLFVLNGDFYIGVPSTQELESYTNIQMVGRIVYGLDGKKIGVVYFDPNTNTVCYVDLQNVKSTFISYFNQQ